MKLLGDVDREDLTRLLSRFGLRLVETPRGEDIRGSYWGGCGGWLWRPMLIKICRLRSW